MNNVKELTQKEINCVSGGYIDSDVINLVAFKALIVSLAVINVVRAAQDFFSSCHNSSPPTNSNSTKN